MLFSMLEIFNGVKMTYYGRWTYKYEEAARQGAQGVFIVHDKRGAGYNWSVVQQVKLCYTSFPSVFSLPSFLAPCRVKVDLICIWNLQGIYVR